MHKRYICCSPHWFLSQPAFQRGFGTRLCNVRWGLQACFPAPSGSTRSTRSSRRRCTCQRGSSTSTFFPQEVRREWCWPALSNSRVHDLIPCATTTTVPQAQAELQRTIVSQSVRSHLPERHVPHACHKSLHVMYCFGGYVGSRRKPELLCATTVRATPEHLGHRLGSVGAFRNLPCLVHLSSWTDPAHVRYLRQGCVLASSRRRCPTTWAR